jgi:hypothetical protein
VSAEAQKPPWVIALAVVGVMLSGILVKLPVLQTVGIYWEDSYWYCLLAQSLERGEYSDGNVPHGRFFPGFPLALAALDLMTGQTFDLARIAAWLSAVSGSLAVALCLPLYRRWGLGELGTALAIIAMLLSAALNLYSALPLYDSFFALFAVLALWLEARGQGRLAALAAGLATLVKPEGAFVVLGVAVASRQWREGLWRLILGGLPLLPWLVRNWLVFGTPLQTDYVAIYQGFQSSGNPSSGLAYLRHYLHFFGPFVIVPALLSIHLLGRQVAALIYLSGTLLLHMLWPGDLERYVLPHAPIVYYLFGATLQRWGAARERWALGLTAGILILFLALHYPDRIAAEATRSTAYARAASELYSKEGSFTVLGPDHAALQMLSGHFAYSAWHELDRPAAEMVAKLVRTAGLRYHLVSNYFRIDRRFAYLQDGAPPTHVPLPDGTRLRYDPIGITLVGYRSAEPTWLGLWMKIDYHLYQVTTYQVSLEASALLVPG